MKVVYKTCAGGKKGGWRRQRKKEKNELGYGRSKQWTAWGGMVENIYQTENKK